MEIRSSVKENLRIFIVELLDDSGQVIDCIMFRYEGAQLKTPAGYEPTPGGARRYCFEVWKKEWPEVVQERRRGGRYGARPPLTASGPASSE